jgi:hypothetical protein
LADKLAGTGQQDSDTYQPTLRWGGYIFTASPTGSRAIAYNPATGEEKSVFLNATTALPLTVTAEVIKPVSDTPLVGLRLQGSRITRVAVFDLKSGQWLPKDLDEPVKGEVRTVRYEEGTAYNLPPHFYTYSLTRGAWDHLDLRTIKDQVQDRDAEKAPADVNARD